MHRKSVNSVYERCKMEVRLINELDIVRTRGNSMKYLYQTVDNFVLFLKFAKLVTR